MIVKGKMGDDRPSSTVDADRRRRPRIHENFPVKVRGNDLNGERFQIDTVLDNIGSKGLYVRLARRVEPGANIFIVVRLSSSTDASVFAPRVAISGEVLRAEPQPDGSCGVAIGFQQHRFL
jgi:hypothetical protein